METTKQLLPARFAAVLALLTDEQQGQLSDLIEEQKANRKRCLEAVKAAMIRALGLNETQVLSSESVPERLAEKLESLKDKARAGEITSEEFKLAASELHAAAFEEITDILDDDQIEIAKIRLALVHRLHHRSVDGRRRRAAAFDSPGRNRAFGLGTERDSG